MPNHIALLRGINLGGRNKVAMADLRAVVAELGHGNVRTYIQSGNVLFSAAAEAGGTTVMAEQMAAAITAKLGVAAPVVILTRDELATVVAANPFPGQSDHKKVHAVILSQLPTPALTERLDAAQAQAALKGATDEVRAVGRTLYLHTPGGYGSSDLAQAILRIVSSPKAGATGTARNWLTMTKLLELCDE
jgi:uncharacterized protein (DUF1697 family)